MRVSFVFAVAGILGSTVFPASRGEAPAGFASVNGVILNEEQVTEFRRWLQPSPGRPEARRLLVDCWVVYREDSRAPSLPAPTPAILLQSLYRWRAQHRPAGSTAVEAERSLHQQMAKLHRAHDVKWYAVP